MYAFVNTLAHKFNIYPLLQNSVYFFNSTFVKQTHYPIISIILFIIVVVLNSIQYANNKNYLQDKIIVSNENYPNGTVNIGNILLFIYETISINGFIDNTPAYIFGFMLAYFALALIELNIGHLSLLFLLFLIMIHNNFLWYFKYNICVNKKEEMNISSLKMCCGSFVLLISIGFIFFLIQKNIINIYYRMIVIFIMFCIWIICTLIDIYDKTVSKYTSSGKICAGLTHHSYGFLFGIICGFVMGK